MDLVITLLTTTTGAGATYLLERARRDHRRRQALARRLAQTDVHLPLDVEHLSPNLAALTVGARTVRLVLQTPLARLQRSGVRELPWRMRERLADYDNALADARRALWHWLCSFRRLDAGEQSLLRHLGLDPRPLRSVMWQPGVFDRTDDVWDASIFPEVPDGHRVTEALMQAIADLRRFEVALLSCRSTPYR